VPVIPHKEKRPQTQHVASHKLEQERLAAKLTFKPSKSGYEGVRCFDLLHTLLTKEPALNIRVPLALILNCGGTSPRLLYYKHDRLKCKELRIKTFQIKRLWLKMITDITKEFSVNFVVPSAVSQYVNTFTKFFMEASEFERSWLDSDIDSVMQVFIPPKGHEWC
jgi:hypothetical protein